MSRSLSKSLPPDTLEEEVLLRLRSGPRRVVELVEEIAYLREVSVQGVYKALRYLRKREVVIVYKRVASLSTVWLSKELERISFSIKAYQSIPDIEGILAGRVSRATFSFRTLNEIDLFWTHAFLLLADKIPHDHYSYSIQPHDWYLYVRFDTDTYWMKQHKEGGRISRIILTHAIGLDHAVTRSRKEKLGKMFEYTLGENPLGQDSATYYNLIGPLIFTARFDATVAKQLDQFVAIHKKLPLSEGEQSEISSIVDTKGEFILTIERNEKRATKMRDKVKKYFEF
jgi:hypothetical protein